MVYEFDPIVLRYDGLEADQGLIDLAQLGQSIQGASRLLASAGTLVETGQYVKKMPAMAVRVVTGPPQPGSFELIAFIVSVSPIIMPMLPTIGDIAKTSATKAVTGVVNYAIAHLGGRKKDSVASRRRAASSGLNWSAFFFMREDHSACPATVQR